MCVFANVILLIVENRNDSERNSTEWTKDIVKYRFEINRGKKKSLVIATEEEEEEEEIKITWRERT